MAQKEVLVIVLDVGKSMSDGNSMKLEGAIKAVNLLVQQKMLFGKSDEVALVLVGTSRTSNDLSYDNITVLKPIGPPDLDLLRKLEKIEPEGVEADLLDGLIVAMDMINKHESTRKFQKRIFLVSDAGSQINNQDLTIILNHFTKMEAKLNIIGIDFEAETSSKSATKISNEKLLQKVASMVHGVIVPVSQALEMMSYFRSKGVLQRSTFRGLLEVGEELKIPIWSFIKTMEQKFPHMTKISSISQQSAQPGGMAVVTERTYQSRDEPDTEVPPDERVRGHRYGKTYVPFSKEDEAQLKYEASSCIKVIGFASYKTIPRHHFMGNSECMVPDPRDQHSGTALSAIIHALAETDSVAIVRYVKRNRSIPHLGFLYPHIRSDYECLYYNSLPFAEDIRQYPFASLAPERARKSFVPNVEQKAAAEQLIRSLDLMKAAEDDEGNPTEALKPKYTYNPVLQRFYQCVQHRALHPGDPLPKLDPLIEQYVNPDKELFHKASSAINNFKEHFTLMKSDSTKEKEERVFWRNMLDGNQVKLDSYVPDPNKKRKMEGDYAAEFSLASIMSGGVSEVGSIRPVEDFKEMLGRRDVDLVDKAIEGMQKRIIQFVNEAEMGETYVKALDCLIALREGCIREEESEQFNQFMRIIKNNFEEKRRDDFWRMVLNKKITLIHYDESRDSSISPEESRQFLAQKQRPLIIDSTPKAKDESVEELLGMVE